LFPVLVSRSELEEEEEAGSAGRIPYPSTVSIHRYRAFHPRRFIGRILAPLLHPFQFVVTIVTIDGWSRSFEFVTIDGHARRYRKSMVTARDHR